MSWVWFLVLELESIADNDIKWNNYFIINEGCIFLLDLVQNWQYFCVQLFKILKTFILVFVLKDQLNYPKPIHNFLFSNFRFRNQKFSGEYEHLRSLRQFVRSSVCYTGLHNVVSTRGADKSLARPGRKQARKHIRDALHFNNIETRAVIRFFFPARQGAEGNSRHSDRNINFFPSWSG